jgi:Pilus formation protein N terminal region
MPSFRAWLSAALLRCPEVDMAETLADLNRALAATKTALDANTAAVTAAAADIAALNAGASDVTAQVDAVNAIGTQIAANTAVLQNASAPPALTASPATVNVSGVGGSSTLTITSTVANSTFSVSVSNPAIVTVSPTSGAGPFTVTEIAPGTTSLQITDQSGNTVSVPVTAV